MNIIRIGFELFKNDPKRSIEYLDALCKRKDLPEKLLKLEHLIVDPELKDTFVSIDARILLKRAKNLVDFNRILGLLRYLDHQNN